MIKAGADPNAAGHVMARNPEFVDDFAKNVDAFIAQVKGILGHCRRSSAIPR